MDVTNRVLIIGTSLLWIFVIFVVILLAWGAPAESIDRIADLAGYLEDHENTGAKLIITFGGLILALLGLIIIILEMAPAEGGQLRVTKVGAGEARIGTDEIALRLEEELRSVPQLSQVQATVIGRGQKADVKLELHVGSEADLALVAEEACHRAQQLVEGRMGVALTGPPKADLHYRELHVATPQGVVSEPAAAVSTAQTQAPQPSGWERLPALEPTQPSEPSTAPSPLAPPMSSTGPSHEGSETPDRPAGA